MDSVDGGSRRRKGRQERRSPGYWRRGQKKGHGKGSGFAGRGRDGEVSESAGRDDVPLPKGEMSAGAPRGNGPRPPPGSTSPRGSIGSPSSPGGKRVRPRPPRRGGSPRQPKRLCLWAWGRGVGAGEHQGGEEREIRGRGRGGAEDGQGERSPAHGRSYGPRPTPEVPRPESHVTCPKSGLGTDCLGMSKPSAREDSIRGGVGDFRTGL